MELTNKDSSSKLYIGHLPLDTTEESLKKFLIKNGFLHNKFSLTVKKGYAFMQCGDQATADRVIDALHGRNFNGQAICVEPAQSTFVGPNTKRIICLLSLVPVGLTSPDLTCSLEDIETIISTWPGTVMGLEEKWNGSFLITVSDAKAAEELISAVNGMPIHVFRVKVEIALDREIEEGVGEAIPRRVSGRSDENAPMSSGNGISQFRPRIITYRTTERFVRSRRSGAPTYRTWGPDGKPSLPWRMLIPAAYVGALIGRGGKTIQGITEATGTRINIHTGNGSRYFDLEKVVTILGTPEAISAACRKILEILAKDASRRFGFEVTLRLMADNSLIGRIIGKGGANITRVMQESGTKIHISNLQELPRGMLMKQVDCDRVITIRGSINGMCLAESLLSPKLRSSYEGDVAQPFYHESKIREMDYENQNSDLFNNSTMNKENITPPQSSSGHLVQSPPWTPTPYLEISCDVTPTSSTSSPESL